MRRSARGASGRACSASTSRASRRRRSCAARDDTARGGRERARVSRRGPSGAGELDRHRHRRFDDARHPDDPGAGARGKHPVRVVITGGTHNPLCPPFDFLERVFLPHLRAMGADVSLTLEKHGLMPERRRARCHRDPAVEAAARSSSSRRGARRRAASDRDRARACRATSASASSRSPQERLDESGVRADRVAERGPAQRVHGRGRARERRARAVTSHGRKGYPRRGRRRRCTRRARGLPRGRRAGRRAPRGSLLLPMAIAGGGRFRTMRRCRCTRRRTSRRSRSSSTCRSASRRDGMVADVIVG